MRLSSRRLSSFASRNPRYEAACREAFAKQSFMKTLGARVDSIAPGAAQLSVPSSAALLQHDGFFHAGVTVTLADTAGGLAALSLFDEDAGVLSSEFKVSLLRPAVASPGSSLIARGRVIKLGRTMTVCASDCFTREGDGGAEVHVATLLLTMVPTAGVRL